MKFLIGIDIGTQGTKAALYSADGDCVAEAFRASSPHRPSPGHVEENPERQLSSVIGAVRECVTKAGSPDVAAIAIAGQMAGVIGVGADGIAVTPYDSWLDTRCGPYIKRMHDDAGDEIIEKTGNVPSFNHGPKKLWWKHERAADYARIRAFVQPGGYVAMRLCGLDGSRAFIDETYLHFSGFADNRKRAWDDALCRRFDLDPAKLPRIHAPHEIIGEITAGMAAQCGLRAGVPVIAGCGDTAASFLSCGATRTGICVVVAGTASVFAATTGAFIADTRSRILGCGRSATPGLWHPYAYINGGGQNLEWFRSEVLGNKHSFDELNALAAESAEDARLPFFVPHLGGRVSPAWPDLRGSWAGLSWDHGAGAMYRAMLEGVALEYALYKEALLAALPDFALDEVHITGGGEKSAVWNQLKADRLQARVIGIQHGGGAPMGAALLAGVGAGVLPDLTSAADQWITLGKATLPDAKQAALSQQRVKKYAALLGTLNQWHTSFQS